jgi:hypothetical protein
MSSRATTGATRNRWPSIAVRLFIPRPNRGASAGPTPLTIPTKVNLSGNAKAQAIT